MATIKAPQAVISPSDPAREKQIGRADHMLNLNLTPTKRFLTVLTGDEAVTFQTFSDREELKIKRPDGTDYDPNAGWQHGMLGGLEPYLERTNAKGGGIYVMVNAGDGSGRSAKDVRSVRALFIDTDGAPFPTDLPLQPHLVVQSSPNKYHLYWLVNDVTLSDFGTLQQALAEHYGTDPSVRDLPRVMRLPGFYHCKGEPVMVQLLEARDHASYNPADIFSAWPFLVEQLECERALKVANEQRRSEVLRRATEHRAAPTIGVSDRARAERLLQTHHDTVASAGEGTRHDTLLRAARALGGYIGGGSLERDEVEDVLSAAAEVCGLPDGEAADVIRWGLDKGGDDPLELIRTGPYTTLLSSKPRSRRSRVCARMRGW